MEYNVTYVSGNIPLFFFGVLVMAVVYGARETSSSYGFMKKWLDFIAFAEPNLLNSSIFTLPE
jgi:hypothetical protein